MFMYRKPSDPFIGLPQFFIMLKNEENLTNEKIGSLLKIISKFTNMVLLVLVIWGNSFFALKNKAKQNVLVN